MMMMARWTVRNPTDNDIDWIRRFLVVLYWPFGLRSQIECLFNRGEETISEWGSDASICDRLANVYSHSLCGHVSCWLDIEDPFVSAHCSLVFYPPSLLSLLSFFLSLTNKKCWMMASWRRHPPSLHDDNNDDVSCGLWFTWWLTSSYQPTIH